MKKKCQLLLSQVHPDLAKVIYRANEVSTLPFIVTEGLRTAERQRQLFRAGATQTLRSRHLTGHAVDLAVVLNGQVRWDWPLYERLANTVKVVANELDIALEWGGDWTSFKDGPHFQLSHKDYPASVTV